MAGLRDSLDRFRRAGTPGAAARSGVPADRAAEAAAELEQVLARFADTQAECRRLRTDAAREADRIRLDARARASQLVANARARATAVRAQAAAAEQSRGDTDSARVVTDAQHHARAVRIAAEQRTAGLVERMVSLVRGVGSDAEELSP